MDLQNVLACAYINTTPRLGDRSQQFGISACCCVRRPEPRIAIHFCQAFAQPDKMASKPNVNRYLKQSLDHIFQNNKKWVSSKKETDATFFDKLSAGQSPDYL